ncbi:deoxyribose-phosphate aldolase [Thermaerobacter marianensis DSM 12885]|uniref:Deoxyribose-phosphate aldolase n=1 Tax=Thermaerobacter marianensis (strain ATCC 700841 / DSM 12885 / JCM 10246 / 7p75a) TaxID=644966 RepID=E6SLB6_THEM7|nr:deoxyribose-phosphate aldolase [Thermaerobacter marianensis]ADU51347.1 deoxyribose-phosphate aldolase [Thermaerobacter marianensis DSM 12885]
MTGVPQEGAAAVPALSRRQLAALIDHTLLKPDATPAQIEQLCREAVEHGFAAVCINPVYVPLAAELLAGAAPVVCTVIDFPLGAGAAADKARQAEAALAAGARELDVVQPIGLLKAGRHREVVAHLHGVVALARKAGALVKVILETGLLTPEEIDLACRLAVEAGAHFVKTSTGFGAGGATEEAVRRMRAAVGPDVGVKASGGIRDYATACRMVAAGANRIGASASLAILAGAPDEPA